MSAPIDCQLIGRWRIVAADLWEGGTLDLRGPAMLEIRADGHGEIAFGAPRSRLRPRRRLLRLGGRRR
ncbi:hypothetical protein, partial [uncultured Amaricoccus sp.]|uniref:hypothetical protein n=1 Tax=uncultured Amaricoccus sp. TaxID=339341 RepID=UPI00262993E6